MSADAVIAAWVPWSSGDAGRYGTKLAAAAELRRVLDEAGYVIVPRVATSVMKTVGYYSDAWVNEKSIEAAGGVWDVMIQESQR